MVTAVFCELGISANNGYLHLSLARIPYSFFNISLLIQGDGRNTQQTVQEVFILLERKSPCQRSMARLARIDLIQPFQPLPVFVFWYLSAKILLLSHRRSLLRIRWNLKYCFQQTVKLGVCSIVYITVGSNNNRDTHNKSWGKRFLLKRFWPPSHKRKYTCLCVYSQPSWVYTVKNHRVPESDSSVHL